jgi:serine/threonine-protein kinase RsbW
VIQPAGSSRLGPGETGKNDRTAKPTTGCAVSGSREDGSDDVTFTGVDAGNRLEFSMTYPVEPRSVSKARADVARFAIRAGVSPAILENVKLAVSEATTNVVVHAYSEQGEASSIYVDAGVQAGELLISVNDSGRGLRPRPDSPGLGLGLAIIAQLAEKVEMLQGGTGGMRILMRFTLNPQRSPLDTAR